MDHRRWCSEEKKGERGEMESPMDGVCEERKKEKGSPDVRAATRSF